MICFRDYNWLPVEGYNQFEAIIQTDDHKKEDVFWFLNFRCVAGGARWRRVRQWERPSLWLEISGFKPKLNDWRDLEQLNFWNLDENESWEFPQPCGYWDLDFYPEGGSEKRESSFLNDGIWRVAGRDGGLFTVELAGFSDGHDILNQIKNDVRVTPDGQEEQCEPDSNFWRANSQLYFIEQIPFGTVTVRVPRNVRDPEAYAVRRAQELIGISRPEHIKVRDHLKASERLEKSCPESIQQDLFVELHLNGYHED